MRVGLYLCVCVLFVAKVGGVHSPLACACWFVFVCVCVIRCKGGRCALTSSLCVLVCIVCVCVLFVAKVGGVHSPLACACWFVFVCVCVIRCKGGRCALTSSLCVLVCICVCVLFVAKVGGVHSPLACACWFVFVCVCYSLQRWEVCTHL